MQQQPRCVYARLRYSKWTVTKQINVISAMVRYISTYRYIYAFNEVHYRLVWSTAHKQMVGKILYERNVATNNQHHDKIENQIKYLPAK